MGRRLVVLIANAPAYEALFGDGPVVEAALDDVRDELLSIIPDSEAVARLIRK